MRLSPGQRTVALLGVGLLVALLAVLLQPDGLPPATPAPEKVSPPTSTAAAASGGAPARPGRSGEAEGSERSPVEDLRLRVVDAGSGEGIAGARVFQLGRRMRTLGEAVSDRDGSVLLARPQGWTGSAVVWREGYVYGAYRDVAREATLRLRRAEDLELELRHVPEHLWNGFGLRASVEYTGLLAHPGSMAGLWALRHHRRRPQARPVPLRTPRARIPLVFRVSAELTITARHDLSGWRARLVQVAIAPGQRRAVVDLSRRAGSTHVLHARVHVPADVAGPMHLLVEHASGEAVARGGMVEFWVGGLARKTYGPVLESRDGDLRAVLDPVDVSGVTHAELRVPEGRGVVVRLRGARSAHLEIRPLGAVAAGRPTYVVRRAGPGMLRVEGLEAGRYRMRASSRRERARSRWRSVDVPPSSGAVELELARPGTLVVRRRAGSRSAGGLLRIVDLSTHREVPLTGRHRTPPRSGVERSIPLPPGRYAVRVEGPGGVTVDEIADVPSGGRAVVRLP